MIVAKRKPLGEIADMIAPYKKITVIGCRSCVAICLAGGEKEVKMLVSALKVKNKKEGRKQQFEALVVERQCEKEWIQEVEDKILDSDLVLSMACSLGAQTIGDNYPHKLAFPALNTGIFGVPEEQGVWSEKCVGCGNCIIHTTGGICPIARCAKSMLNGPCGGSSDGHCEVNLEIDCAWYAIHERLKLQNRLELIEQVSAPKDWSTSHSGGRRTYVREDAKLTQHQKKGKGAVR
ncbi:MAG: methylenetetrahydrofolate reductase C-terminal domain-containing protein [Candidatus Thermoplasmatota archaeon]|nr:methylenetetrahydrofolate reductase C-terminal domain-containing protein [Candidatus Thermoplasmatota archaeon]